MLSDRQDTIHAGGEIPVREIHSCAFVAVCPILLMSRHSLHNNDSAGNKIMSIPAACAVMQVICTRENEIKNGFPQQ